MSPPDNGEFSPPPFDVANIPDLYSVYTAAMKSKEFLFDVINHRGDSHVIKHVFERHFNLFKRAAEDPCFLNLPTDTIKSYLKKTNHGVDLILFNSVRWDLRLDIIKTVRGVTRDANPNTALVEIMRKSKMSLEVMEAFEILTEFMRMDSPLVSNRLLIDYGHWKAAIPPGDDTNRFYIMVAKLLLRLDEMDNQDTSFYLRNRGWKKIMTTPNGHLSHFLMDIGVCSDEMRDLIILGFDKDDPKRIPVHVSLDKENLLANQNKIIEDTRNLIKNYVTISGIHEE